MIELAQNIIGTQPILAIFLAIGVGYLVGQINLGGFSLGVGAVLFVGLAIGAFAPKASKLNPAAGLKRMFGLQGLIELVKSVAKVALLGAIGVWMIWDRLTEIVGLGRAGLAPAMADLGNMFILTCLVMAGGLFLIAGIDVPAQLMQRSRRLSMALIRLSVARSTNSVL